MGDPKIIPRWTLPIRICDFCGKENHEVKALFTTPSSSKCICNRMHPHLCKQVIEDEDK